MSDALQVDVSVQVKDALRKLDKDTVERLVNLALKSGALLIANEWKQEAPYKTGTYRRSIHIAGAEQLTPDFDGPRLEEPSDKLTVKIGTNITEPPYPVFQEFGAQAKDGGYMTFYYPKAGHWVSVKSIPAHPFLGPAMDENRTEVLKEVGDALADLIAKELGSL